MKQITTKNNDIILVDDDDFEYLNQYTWHLTKNGYVRTNMRIDGIWKKQLMHKLITNTTSDEQVDHRDRNGLNNQRDNLRLCTNGQNQQNRGLGKNNTSGFCGVWWNKRNKKYVAGIRASGQKIHLGYFDDKIEAAKIYNEAALKYHGEFATLNPV